jgi:THAP4-like, heme-binding beta-barrel domain
MTAPDTSDLRSGAPLHDALLALLPLVGVWRGAGRGIVASSGEEFTYGQQIQIVHDGRPFLAYESRSWLVDETGAVIRQAWRESGFWRPGAGPDDVELVVASNTGQALVFAGTAGDQRWDLATVSAEHSPSAKDVDGERRLYAIREDGLVYATELAPGGQPYAPHLNARLARVRAS